MQTCPSPAADHEVLPRLAALVARDRATTAEMLVLIGRAHVRRLHASTKYPSMYRYCVGELGMSEDMAWKRIQAAKAARRFPVIFAMLADGRLHLTAVVRLAPHLSKANARELLATASGLSKRELQQLLAERFPQPDMPVCITPLVAAASVGQLVPEPVAAQPSATFSAPAEPLPRTSPAAAETPAPHLHATVPAGVPPAQGASAAIAMPWPLGRITPLSPDHIGVQFVFRQAALDKLGRVQALLGHAVPAGDLAQVFERALDALVERLEKRKFAATSRPREGTGPRPASLRCIPAAVRRAVRVRDGERCTFVTEQGERCEARERLEFDHIQPVACGGESTVANVRLRCHTHNQHEAERAFGAEFMERKRAEGRRRTESRRAAERARDYERARREARERELAANTEAQARACEVMPWLRQRTAAPR